MASTGCLKQDKFSCSSRDQYSKARCWWGQIPSGGPRGESFLAPASSGSWCSEVCINIIQTSASIFTWLPFLCVSVSLSSSASYKDTGHRFSGHLSPAWFNHDIFFFFLNHIFKNPYSKWGHIQRVLVFRFWPIFWMTQFSLPQY